MVIRFLIFLLTLNFPYKLRSQVRITNSFIIVINNKLQLGSIAKPELIIKKKSGDKEKLEIDYIPGVLYCTTNEDKEKIYSDSVTNLILSFDAYNEVQHVKNYEIPLNKKWLNYSFIVLNIFDLKKKKGVDHYRYSFDFPSYSIIPMK